MPLQGPDSISATLGDNLIVTVRWSPSAGAVGYSVYSSRDGGINQPFATPGGQLITDDVFSVALTANHSYAISVQASDGVGGTAFSGTVTVDTHPGVTTGRKPYRPPGRSPSAEGVPQHLR